MCLGFGPSASISDGLVGYWPLNGDAQDYSGLNNHGNVLPGRNFVSNPAGDGFVLQAAGDRYTGRCRWGYLGLILTLRLAECIKHRKPFWVMFDDHLTTPTRNNFQEILVNPLPDWRMFIVGKTIIIMMAQRVEVEGK